MFLENDVGEQHVCLLNWPWKDKQFKCCIECTEFHVKCIYEYREVRLVSFENDIMEIELVVLSTEEVVLVNGLLEFAKILGNQP